MPATCRATGPNEPVSASTATGGSRAPWLMPAWKMFASMSDLDRVPLVRPEVHRRSWWEHRRERRRRRGRATTTAASATAASSTALPGRRGWRWRRRDSDLPARRARQRHAIGDASLRIDVHRTRSRLTTRGCGVEALQTAGGGPLGSHHQACDTRRRASERCGNVHVLISGLEQQPATVRVGRRADDLAVLDAPRRRADRARAVEIRGAEGPVRHEETSDLSLHGQGQGGRGRCGGNDDGQCSNHDVPRWRLLVRTFGV